MKRRIEGFLCIFLGIQIALSTVFAFAIALYEKGDDVFFFTKDEMESHEEKTPQSNAVLDAKSVKMLSLEKPTGNGNGNNLEEEYSESWGLSSQEREIVNEGNAPLAFHVSMELDLAYDVLLFDGFRDKLLVLFPHFCTDDQICNFVSCFIEKYYTETAGFDFSLDAKTLTVLFDKTFSEDEMADLFVFLINFCNENKAILSPAKSDEKAIDDSNMVFQINTTELWQDDDFWADFYISGEDLLLFEDGNYYMNLYVNGENRGSVSVEMLSQIPYIAIDDLRFILENNLTEEAYERIFNTQSSSYSLEDLEKFGVRSSFEANNYKIYLSFDLDDMPFTSISLSPSYSRYDEQPLAGAEIISPAVFSFKSSYNTSFGWYLYQKKIWDYDVSLYSTNTMSMYDIFLDFSYYLNFNNRDLDFSLSSYTFRRDFEEKMLRLSWGCISPGIISPLGTPIGIRLSKNLSYSNDSYERKSPYEAELTVEKESLVEVINDDRVLYSKILNPGKYKLEDFVLYTGVNRVLIKVSPTDGSAPKEIIHEFSYYSSLLYPGEFYYNLSLAIGRETLLSKDKIREGSIGFSLGGKYYQYDPRNLSLSFDYSYGLSNSLLLRGAIAVSNLPTDKNQMNMQGKVNFELTQASSIGTTRYNLNLYQRKLSDGNYHFPEIYARVSHQANLSKKHISSINASLGFSSPPDILNSNRFVFNVGISTSGKLGLLSYGIGSNFNLYTDVFKSSSYTSYLSLGFSPQRNINLSTSINLSGNFAGNVGASASVYASVSFGSGNVSSSLNEKSTKVNFNMHSLKSSLSSSIDMPGYNSFEKMKSFRNSNFYASYATSTDYFNFGFGISSSLDLNRLSGNLSLSTSTIFADGFFALSSSIGQSYLLIKQKGELKGNDLSIGYSGAFGTSKLNKFFSMSLYSAVSSVRNNQIMIYSTSEDSISGPRSFALYLPKTNGRGFVYTLESNPVYAMTAIVTDINGNPWINDSSPLYLVSISGDFEIDVKLYEDGYVFSDESGRIILSDLPEGLYGFDIPNDDGWALALIEISEKNSPNEMNVYIEAIDEISGMKLPEQYSSCKRLVFSEALSSDEFWDLLYPGFKEAL